ncbi:lipopolysaccharide heptosyltransferase III [Sulfuricella denitrificans skB26]|uniref:Lipopolysaccharide heptosyltransferase III n=1 Tax=Sulfuricella denitrificans (strain DSM 22764 / NBRC 105220 / skB26) TaxID=1163617 RepID=S6ABC8_SULDS|nr:putative lipopolysaccharide heptosyltransferase III [Sulfuricella denitrificans]BAN36660.1 lipopolysaccharide heptosyltransferase III [Sulfuricella denitrificans skB26]
MLKDAIDLSTLSRVLVIKLRHHGDVLLTSPVFSVLKNHAPHLEIDALVYQDTAEMLSLHPAISQLHAIDRTWKSAGILTQAKAEWKLLSALRARRYDLVIHLTEHNRGAWLTRLLGARYGVAEKLRGKGRFWYNSFSHLYPIPIGFWRHRVELNLDALRRIGVYPAGQERHLTLVPGKEAEAFIDKELEQQGLRGKTFLHLHPTSRWQFKCWPEEKMSALIDALQREGHRVVLTAGPGADEMAAIKRITASLSTPVTDLSGRLSLKQLAALTSKAQAFIGVDSAPMHIAAAMGTPTAVLFGPSGDPEWGPWQVPHRIIISNHTCRPCGNDGCGGGKLSECLQTISVAEVLEAVHSLLLQGRENC